MAPGPLFGGLADLGLEDFVEALRGLSLPVGAVRYFDLRERPDFVAADFFSQAINGNQRGARFLGESGRKRRGGRGPAEKIHPDPLRTRPLVDHDGHAVISAQFGQSPADGVYLGNGQGLDLPP